VLVVCYGNIYRSAFVGAGLKQAHLEGVEVRSAGFHPQSGRVASQRMVVASRVHGVYLGAHQSSVVQPSDLSWADTIILMDRHNWQALIQSGADAARFVWLGTLDGGAVEVPDPYERDENAVQQIVARLAACTHRLADRIKACNATCRI